ncbi:MAG: hypothetical protein ACI9MD_001215, partial [Psychrobacter glaciei]
ATGSVTTGNTVTDTNGVAITDGTVGGAATTMTAAGTNVTDGTNTSNYGATGFSATDAAGNNGISVNQGGISFIDGVGAPTGPSVTAAGFNAGGTVITNVASGGDVTDAANATNGVNAGDVNTAINGVTAAGLNFAGDSGTDVNRPLGSTLDITGGSTATLTAGNIGVVANGTDGLSIQLAEAVDLGEDGSVTTGDTVVNNAGVRVDDGNGNVTAVTTAGTNVTDDNGNTGNYGAESTVLTDDAGNTNASAAIGNAIFDNSGNVNLSGAIGNAIFDDSGNANLSGATGNVIFDDAGNATINSATGTDVTDGTNNSNYGANGLIATDDAGNSTIVNQTGLSFTDNLGANTGPSITAAGIDAGGAVIANVADGIAATDAATKGQVDAAVTSVTDLGLSFAGDSGTDVQRKLGETLNIKGGSNATLTAGNIGVVANGTDGLSVQLAEAIDLGATGSVTTGNTVTDTNGVVITDGTVGGAATTMTAAGTTVTDGTNTSNYGATGFTATDAAGNNGISINQGGISFIDAAGASTGPSITAAGIDAGGLTVSNLADGVNADDAATKGQVDAVSDGLTDLTAGAVQYERDPNDNSIINYDQVTLAGTSAVIDQDDEGNDFVANGGTTLSNVANGVDADDAVNKGQLDTLISQNITNVEVTDQNGNPVTVNVTDQVVNGNIDDSNLDSLFLTYDVSGQEVTDRLTIAETVQKMNTEGVKFAHTNAVSTQGDLGITNDSSAGADNSTAIGVNAIVEAGANNTVALGLNTRASEDATDSVVIGAGSQVSGQSAIAIGDGSQANGNQSIAIGTGNIVNGNNSGAFGDPTIINGNNSYSVGNNNNVITDDTFVLGNNVTSTVAGSVVLGTGSAARTGAGIAGYRSMGDAAIMATTSTTGAVAVGDASNGIYRQVTGVAAGTADSDAVNVSQLKSVSDALESSNAALSNAAVQYDTNPDDTVNKGSITLGGGAAGTTITNVNGGAINAGSTDAINGGQLFDLGNDVAGIIGGDAALDADGNLTASNIGGTGANNLNDAIAAVNNGNAQANEDIQANTDRLDTGLSFSADTGANVDKSIGDSTAVSFEGSDNITTTTTDSGIKFDLSGNISVDSVTADTVTTGNTTVNSNGVTIANGPSMTTEGINAGSKTITGVADGVEVNDAVNFGQLSALDGKLSNSVNELGYKINEVEDDANAGISAAMAMSSLPQAYIPGKSMVGGGIATYNGQSAVAIGLSKVSDNGRWVIKVNGTADTQGNAGGAVGAGFHF